MISRKSNHLNFTIGLWKSYTEGSIQEKLEEMGIDGYYIDNSPIQVKQSEDAGRNATDDFETSMERIGKNKGVWLLSVLAREFTNS